jgi:hypothetical protein
MVFITIGEPQAHDDRLVTCGRLVIGLLRHYEYRSKALKP